MPSDIDFLHAVLSSADGLSMGEFLALNSDVPRRTAQRWANHLTHEGKIIATGKGRARRYVSAGGGALTQEALEEADVFPSFIPLSADSMDVLAYINQPVEARKPVGYQHEFLEVYIPGKTWYLSETLRNQLRKMGQTQKSGLPAGTFGREILNRLLIDLSWASSHLEGNTYSRLETRELIEHGRASEGKALIETQMILNHKEAIEMLVDNIDSVGFNRFTLMNLQSALSENLLPNPADEGRIREHSVEIGKSVFRPLTMAAQISEQFDKTLEKASQIPDPFEQSFFIMVYLPYLQPFADVNKRTSRLAANLPLIRANLCPMTFLDVPERAYSRAILGVYELTRIELLRDLYVWAYERSTQEYLAIKQGLAEPDPVRLRYRSLIKEVIHKVVKSSDEEPLGLIQSLLDKRTKGPERENVEALIIEELKRLHEGVLARYELRPAEFEKWKSKQSY